MSNEEPNFPEPNVGVSVPLGILVNVPVGTHECAGASTTGPRACVTVIPEGLEACVSVRRPSSEPVVREDVEA